jgi:hypothetical protein
MVGTFCFEDSMLFYNGENKQDCSLINIPFHAIFLIMTIEQTVAIPADYRIFLELPRSVPIGANARVSINIPTEFDSQSGIEPIKSVKSYRGILKGRGISVERLRELQREDKVLEERQNNEIR